jgi:hypothetical protein
MTNRVLSILDLNDIVEPTTVGLWPFAPVLTVLLALVIAGLLFIAIRKGMQWHRAAYRREALRLLDSRTDRGAIMVLLKRVALVTWSRETVAPLHGDEWVDFLNCSCARSCFQQNAELKELSKQASLWIRHHRRPGAC